MIKNVLLVLLAVIISACGVNGSGDTTHKIEGEAQVTHRIVVDFEVCDDLPVEDKIKCINKITEALGGLTKGANDVGQE